MPRKKKPSKHGDIHIVTVHGKHKTGHVVMRLENEPSVDEDGFYGIGIDGAAIIEDAIESLSREERLNRSKQ